MNVQVKLYALARDLAETDCLEVSLPDGARVAELRAAIARQVPQLAPLLGSMAFAVDTEYARDDTPLSTAADIACIPPVSGG